MAGALYPTKDLITNLHPKNEVQDDDDENVDTSRDSNDDDNDNVQEDEDEDEDYEHVEDAERDGYYDDGIMQYICNSSKSEAWDGSMKMPHRKVDHFEKEDDKYSPHTQSSLDLDRGDVDELFIIDYWGGYASD